MDTVVHHPQLLGPELGHRTTGSPGARGDGSGVSVEFVGLATGSVVVGEIERGPDQGEITRLLGVGRPHVERPRARQGPVGSPPLPRVVVVVRAAVHLEEHRVADLHRRPIREVDVTRTRLDIAEIHRSRTRAVGDEQLAPIVRGRRPVNQTITQSEPGVPLVIAGRIEVHP